ncbi:MAG: NAD(P)/FAD-dependent oxidoreductase, partial [Phycisphaerales bacterium]
MPRLERIPPSVDIAVIGAGAAGLMAAIWAGRTALAAKLPLSIVALDGAKKLGAKILVAGGGRCNVTHHAVDETAYAGASRNAIKKVLRSFTVEQTVAFFNELGVQLKREETGKLFPTTDDAHTVLDALLAAARGANAELLHPWRVGEIGRVGEIRRESDGFLILEAGPTPECAEPAESSDHPRQAPLAGEGRIRARRIILATGGKALPRSGSDGSGYVFARVLGHSVTPRVFPALVPLVLEADHFIRTLTGLTLPPTLEVRSGTGNKLAAFTNST